MWPATAAAAALPLAVMGRGAPDGGDSSLGRRPAVTAFFFVHVVLDGALRTCGMGLGPAFLHILLLF
jgi:hypothetical protein